MKIPSRKLATARLFAASRSDPRAYLHGVLFDYDHERIVSTDGRALCVIPCDFGDDKPTGRVLYLLPRGSLGDYCELTADGVLTVYNRQHEGQERYQLFTQDASKYPYFDRLLPTTDAAPQNGQICLISDSLRLLARILPAGCPIQVTVYGDEAENNDVVEVRANDGDNYEELAGMRVILGPTRWTRKEL